jgi:hypothetical protein
MAKFQSGDPNVPAVVADNTGGGFGLVADSNRGTGVHGVNDAPAGASIDPDRGCGVWGESTNGYGVFGISDNHEGIKGISKIATGVHGMNDAPAGSSLKPDRGCGILGESTNGYGVFGSSDNFKALRGISKNDVGVDGGTNASDQSGIFGINNAKGQVPDGLNRPAGNGVWGHTTVEKGSGVVGSVDSGLSQAAGVTGIGAVAGRFFGKVECTGPVECPKSTITCFDVALAGADCAEEFELARPEQMEPGAVMSFDQDGALRLSSQAYDKKVAGVISGAGDYKPGIVLDRKQERGNRAPLALVGKAYCLADAQYGSIEVGDLLTTSPTPAHAMKATDHEMAFGAIIGKALRSLAAGQGLIPVLITLR